MTEYVDDRIAYPHLLGLKDALADELDARGLPGLCETLIGVGAEVAFDFCDASCDGMGWARLAGAFTSSDFPIPDVTPHRGVLLMAETFEVGLVRGMELPTNPEDGMDPAVLDDAGRTQMADMSAILAVICAYFRSRSIPFIVGNYTPYGPAGACVGGYWQVTAQTGVAPKVTS